MSFKVTYFGIPALGEPIRLLLHLGKFKWEDNTIEFKDWAALKPTTKWGQLPMLTLPDGTEMTQTKPIVHYLAAQVNCTKGMLSSKKCYPSDLMLRFQIDEMIEAMEDSRMKMLPSFKIKDQKEKEAARAALFADGGEVDVILKKMDSLVGDKFVVGNTFTLADIWFFFWLNFVRSGFWDGVPLDFLDKYPKLKAIVSNVANMPEVKEYYVKKAAENKSYSSFVE
jgi:glutathione S-transferase